MDKQLAILLGKICDYVYGFEAGALPDLGNPNVVRIHETGEKPVSNAGILRYPDKTVLAFQGTITNKSVDAVKDWLFNFVVLRIHALGLPGKVHAGFAKQLELIWDQILTELKNKYNPPLYVTGHSQGAAVAALATKALELEGIKVEATYTFAAPRPGDADFAASVNTPVFRIEYGDDIVPHVPFHGFKLVKFQDLLNEEILKHDSRFTEFLRTAAEGYRAVGPLTYRRPGTDLHVNISVKDEEALARTRDMLLIIAGDKLFSNHHMTNYIDMFA